MQNTIDYRRKKLFDKEDILSELSQDTYLDREILEREEEFYHHWNLP